MWTQIKMRFPEAEKTQADGRIGSYELQQYIHVVKASVHLVN